MDTYESRSRSRWRAHQSSRERSDEPWGSPPDILACRTEALGGHLWRCDHCSAEVYSYHSCKNRSCLKCHTDQTEQWLAARKAEVLPCPYFHVTITVPEELREALRANQKDGYALLMKAAAEAIIELAREPRYVGGTVGILAVLHTWTQQLLYHPHVHCLVTGGGVSDDGQHWHPARNGFLVPYAALAKLVRGKLRAALVRRRPDLVLPETTWSKRWVVHCTAWGEGDEAVLRYLARYVFRVAITNNRIVGLDETGVTLRHKHRASNRWRTTRLAETLLPLLAEDKDTAVEQANEALAGFSSRFEMTYAAGLRRKLGLFQPRPDDLALAQDLLERMARNGADFTLTFRRLCDAAASPAGDVAVRSLFTDPPAFDEWGQRWRRRLIEDGGAADERRAAMRTANPAFIPRNHLVEEALSAAVNSGDLAPFEALLTVLSKPYEDQPAFARYADPPRPEQIVRQTFCGT